MQNTNFILSAKTRYLDIDEEHTSLCLRSVDLYICVHFLFNPYMSGQRFCLFYISFYLYLVCDFEGLEIQDTCSSSQKRQDQIFNIITNVQQQHNSNHLIGQLNRTTSTTSLVSKTEKQQPPLVGQKNRTVALNHLKSVEQGNSNYLI